MVELHCTYDPETTGWCGSTPDGRKVRGTIHWVSASESIPIEARLYDRLFSEERPDRGKGGEDFKTFLNPDSLQVASGARAEPALADFEPGSRFQFERLGYFYWDPEGHGDRPVLNRTVGLRDTWTRKQTVEIPATTEVAAAPVREGAAPTLSDAERQEADRLVEVHNLPPMDAERLARDETSKVFFEASLEHHGNAGSLASWVLNEVRGELLREASEGSGTKLSPADVATLVAEVDSERISGKIAKEILAEMIASGRTPSEIIAAEGLEQISDEAALMATIDAVLVEHPGQLEDYRNGKTALRGFFRRPGHEGDRGSGQPDARSAVAG